MERGFLTTGRRNVLAIAAATAVSGAAFAAPAASARSVATANHRGRRQPFDDDWRFRLGEMDGAQSKAFDDTDWRRVDLPHDWSVEDLPGQLPGTVIGPFDKRSIGKTATGFTNGGEGWYRKHFRADAYPAGASVEIVFDGAYLETDVWLNGRQVGGSVAGYAPFALDLTPFLDRTGDNVVAVRVRNLGRNSRWYSGSGLYRSVELDIVPSASRLVRWGVAAWTSKLENGRAVVDVSSEVVAPESGDILRTRLVEPDGRVVAEASAPAAAAMRQTLEVRGPRLWSAASPELYSLETELVRNGSVLDRIVQPYGIRIIAFDARTGMTVNGQQVKLKGGCLHHDNGLLGACAFPDADERRLRLLKARGFNAIRSSHNPASRSLREACDRLGMYLIEEAFDAWHVAKEPQDFAQQFPAHWSEVIDAMVRTARNNPSVIMWSIGNEIPFRSTEEGVEWQWKLANAVRRLDPTRPITAGLNGVLGAELIAAPETARAGRGGKTDNASTVFLDVPGYNYRLEDIEAEEGVHPERVVYASETFARDVYDYQALQEKAPYFLGEFLWTAMDYLGEAGIGANARLKNGNYPIYLPSFPWVNAWCGDIDLIGQQKASSLARDVVWGISDLEMAVQRPGPEGTFEYVSGWGWSDELASWTWPGAEGRPLGVRVHAAGDRVELRLDGKLVASRNLGPGDRRRAEFEVPYAPGKLEAIAYRNSKPIARKVLETVGPAARVRVVPERREAGAARNALSYLRVDITDAQGRVLPDDRRRIDLLIEGPATLAAFGSANPHATGSFQSSSAECYRGQALLILRGSGKPGRVRIKAKCEGLAEGGIAFDLS
ncbi:glycoside hydrolase family 2 TIM barrel-domain containing protein [Novosphingobium sp. ST904]|uniref:glycoside hydrolase family 2 TIM barrel-domain containing protein n=1 Tax=Novosphingobium sp. ST904 TaxID=1684385 RepID=UPI00104C452F|nr:glycoside hydrolase family 2 TIM barrel-domain containing protein [Novosphingobium sp. ST904]TCM41485.1 beta-galactosidase [Novosphingobium sp. ST904]